MEWPLISATLHCFWDGLYDWLAWADPASDADLIFALAGRQSRKIYSLRLFSGCRAKELLLSVGRFEIRRFSELAWPIPLDLLRLAAPIPPPKRHFFVWLGSGTTEVETIYTGKLGTWSEIVALSNWLVGRPNVKSVLIVSSACHLRRVRLCCRALLPNAVRFRFLAADDDAGLQRERWWRDPQDRAIVLLELPKLLLYWPLLQLQRLKGRLRAGKQKGRHGSR